jgi:DNA-binding transcriptional LysR family regulator
MLLVLSALSFATAEIVAGLLVPVLDEFAAPPNGIYAVFPQRKHLPLRVRLWIDFLKQTYGNAAYWQDTAGPA